MAKRKLVKNRKLFAQAKRYLVAGVDSPVRSFSYVGGRPVLIKRGFGSRVFDYDGNEYIDYVLSWGALILGHSHPQVLKEIKKALGFGLGFGTTNEAEVGLAKLIRQSIPFAQKIRFVNSGTEAVMAAIRLARGYTKRDKIIKFENSYHGHADYLLAKGGSGLATLQIASSAGVPEDFIKHTLVIPFGKKEHLEKIFEKYGKEIAAVLVEPAGGNYGVVPTDSEFLNFLRELTKKYGALLVFDEVITGYRFNFGSLAGLLNITPDLICLGKIIGGGLPVGAYAGSAGIMDHLAPLGDVYQASTFSGNPVVMNAGIKTLGTLRNLRKSYHGLAKLTEYLSAGLQKEANLRNINLKVSHFGSMFSLKFKEKKAFRRFYGLMLERGVYLAPSEFEANFLSFAHTKKDVDQTLAAARWALERCKK